MDRVLAITSFRRGKHHGRSAPATAPSIPFPCLTHILRDTLRPHPNFDTSCVTFWHPNPLSRGLWVFEPDRVITTEILDSLWHVHGKFIKIRTCYCGWHNKAPKRQRKVTHISHFTPLVFMVQGVGALTSSPCCNYLSAPFIRPIVLRKRAKRGWGRVVKT